MKKIICLAILLLLCVGLFACGEDEDTIPEGMKLASDPEVVEYTLYVPIEWTVSSAGATTQAFAQDRTNINIAQWNYTGTIDSWWEDEYKKQVFDGNAVTDEKITTYKDGKEGVKYTLDEKEGKKYEYTGKVGDTYFKYTVIACMYNGSVHVIHITYMQDPIEAGAENADPQFSSVETHKEEINTILDNFKFN